MFNITAGTKDVIFFNICIYKLKKIHLVGYHLRLHLLQVTIFPLPPFSANSSTDDPTSDHPL